MLNFDKDYFKDEEREGFLVESMMKRAWASQLEVLMVIDGICKKYGIQYFIFWGTLLGAVRHKGYVPWDDDMDIIMKRADFQRFITVARYEMPKDYTLLSLYTEPEWNDLIARVVNTCGIDCSEGFLDQFHGCPYACGIDIFPYDYMVEDPEQQKEVDTLMRYAVTTLEAQLAVDEQKKTRHYADKKLEKKIDENLKYYEKKYDFKFSRDNYLGNQLLFLFDQLAQGYASENAEYMTCYAERRKRYKTNGGDFLIPKFLLEETVEVDFEGIKLPAPKYYELCLTRGYGKNFMTPIKGGGAHDYPFYSKQIKILEDAGKYDFVMGAVANYVKKEEEASVSEFINNVEATKDDSQIAAEQEIAELQELIKQWKVPDKKVVVCCFSIMDAYETEEKFVAKLKDTIEFFKGVTDKTCMILLEAPYVDEILALKDENLAIEYRNLVNSVMESDWALAVSPDQFYGIFDLCDAYYGSGNEYIKPFQMAKKPIMIQNVDILNS